MTRQCEWCGTSFAVYLSPSKLATGRGRYCSRSCLARGRWTREMAIERFWHLVEKTDGCWEWRGCMKGNGYGCVTFMARYWHAHRLAWTLTHGSIPDGLTLDHLCRNTRCVNPAHLEPVTMAENILRGFSPPAQHARKTHCIRGHELAGDNVYIRRDTGGRQCRACARLRDRIRYAAGRAA